MARRRKKNPDVTTLLLVGGVLGLIGYYFYTRQSAASAASSNLTGGYVPSNLSPGSPSGTSQLTSPDSADGDVPNPTPFSLHADL